METVKIKKETFDKIGEFKKNNPDCKNLDDALALMISDLENNLKLSEADAKTQREEMEKFRNGLHDKNRELEKMQKEYNDLLQKGIHGTDEQAAEIERLKNEIEQWKQQFADSVEKMKNLLARIDELTAANEELQQTANANGQNSMAQTFEIENLQNQIAELKQAKSTGENTITLNTSTAKILDLVAKKLSERYQQQITRDDVVDKMILRYNVERFTQWFYPFVVTDKEIEEATGKKINELKDFINGKN